MTILLDYAKRDDRIAVYSQPHLGVGNARNVGIREAAGEYIYFMDSDDILKPFALEHMVQCAEKYQLDTLYFNAEAFYDENCKEEEFDFQPKYSRNHDYPAVTKGHDLFAAFCENYEYVVTVWMTLYRRQFIKDKGIRFYTGIVHSDNTFTFQAIACADRAGYLNECLYERRIRPNSIMTSGLFFRSAYSYYAVCNTLCRYGQEYAPQLDDKAIKQTIKRIQLALSSSQADYNKCSDRDRGRELALGDDALLFHKMVVEPCLLREGKNLSEQVKTRELQKKQAEIEKLRTRMESEIKKQQQEKKKIEIKKDKDIFKLQTEETRLKTDIQKYKTELDTIKSSRVYRALVKLRGLYHGFKKILRVD